MRLTTSLVCCLAVSSAACGGGSSAPSDAAGFGDAGVASCTLVQRFDGGIATLCFETLADVGPSFQQSCDQNAASAAASADAGAVTFVDGPCSRADALGACQANVDGLIENQWYYGSGGDSGTSVFGQTASNIKSLCADMGDIYLPP